MGDRFRVLSKWADSEATYVILHGLFGGIELLVVRAATRLMNKSGVTDRRRWGGQDKDRKKKKPRVRAGGHRMRIKWWWWLTDYLTVPFPAHMQPLAYLGLKHQQPLSSTIETKTNPLKLTVSLIKWDTRTIWNSYCTKRGQVLCCNNAIKDFTTHYF